MYYTRSGVSPGNSLMYIPSAVAGGITGAVLLNKFKPVVIKKIFAVLVIWAGLTMLFG